MSDDSLYVVHGGSDFDKINPSRFGSGEPGGIRPLGKGLYSFVIDHKDPKRAAYAIDYAKRYSKKYGYESNAVHVFKIPKSISTSWNGSNDIDRTKNPEYPKKIEGLGGYPEKEYADFKAVDAKYQATKGTPEEGDSWNHAQRAYEKLKESADVRFEHLPIGLTEASIHNPEVATRIGKFDLDTPTEDILGMVKNDAANVPHKEDGGGITDNGSNAYEDAIKEALQNYDHVGLRTVEKPIKGPLKNSSVWNDGKPSNKKLNGVSATDVNDKTSRIEHGLTKESGSYHGPYTYVLGSDRADHGEDRGEKIMHNPEILFGGHRDTILGKKSFDSGGGITAYQGGPHSVGEEGFLDEKIGTGEGAQAYGHGHYFAEAEPVAQGYRDALAQQQNPTKSINDLISKMSGLNPERRTPQIIQYFMKFFPMLSPHADDKEVVGHISEALNGQNADGSVSESAIDAYGKLTDKFGRNHKGHMHEVSINAHPDHFLDWDKPLSEQSPHIVKSIFDARKDNPTLFNVFKSHLEKDSTGMGFYQSLATHHPNGAS